MPTPTKPALERLHTTKPIVALIGRENVGKSTLFNRLVGVSSSIISNVPGTTRDRLFGDVVWRGKTFVAVDTAGLAKDRKGFVADIHEQAEMALHEANVILFMVDGKDGVTPVDLSIARWLSKARKKVIVLVNKIDKPEREESLLLPFYELGFEEVIGASALSGKLVGDVLDTVLRHIDFAPIAVSPDSMKVSIVGKPNVGKSSLLNALIHEKRVRVSPVAGTTRDAVAVTTKYKEKLLTFVDTAGLRRKAKIHEEIEKSSSMQSLHAINESEIVLALFDATEKTSQQDLAIVRYAFEARKAIIIVINKWDLEKSQEAKYEKYIEYFQSKLPLLYYVPIIFVSANTGQNIPELMSLIEFSDRQYHQTIPQEKLDEVFKTIPDQLGAIGKIWKRRLKVWNLTQIASGPPGFQIEINKAELLSNFHIDKIENILRAALPLEGTPIVLHFKVKGSKV
jgi:GTP-binding protein